MANQTCPDCGSTYDPDSVNLPSTIPDKMCAKCGTTLTDAEIAALQSKQGAN